PAQDPLPVWIAVGGTPESAARAGLLGLPLALAIIGGDPARFATFAQIHRAAAAQAGHERPKFSINSHGLIADDSGTAVNAAFPPMKEMMDRIGRERGWGGGPMTREQFEHSRGPRGANFVGSPEEIAEKIVGQYEIFEHDRFLIMFTVGPLAHTAIMRSIELYGTRVAPLVRTEIAKRHSDTAPELPSA
ncbi:MAG TPA: LLM class flavin-dependent oxidoreductase, partial [Vicinamibacterales bacterium]|nr:LLM class flavin-dependent oxidoreductase [Vicinamibacterales bacterium]